MKELRPVCQEGIDLIKRFEGCRLKAYQDIRGVWTIGYGHTADVIPHMIISQQVANRLLVEDLRDAAKAVCDFVSSPLTDFQYAAVCSLVYNIGRASFSGSSMRKLLNKKEYLKAANEFPRWVYSGSKVINGLVRRRAAERDLFLRSV